MEILDKNPPNWSEIKVLNPPKTTVFCYGDTIFNPSGGEVPEDVIFHEQVHSDRQGNDPKGWWLKYINDRDFRLKEEVLAFGGQYAFIKRHYPSQAHKQALFELATNLSTNYGFGFGYPQAEALIRRQAKNLV